MVCYINHVTPLVTDHVTSFDTEHVTSLDREHVTSLATARNTLRHSLQTMSPQRYLRQHQFMSMKALSRVSLLWLLSSWLNPQQSFLFGGISEREVRESTTALDASKVFSIVIEIRRYFPRSMTFVDSNIFHSRCMRSLSLKFKRNPLPRHGCQ